MMSMKCTVVLAVLLSIQIAFGDYDVLDAMRDIQSLGDLTIDPSTVGPLLAFDQQAQSLSFQCNPLFQPLLNLTAHWPPPRYPSYDQLQAYTMGGKMAYRTRYYADQQNGREVQTWSTELIRAYQSLPNRCGPYQTGLCAEAFDKYRSHIQGKRGMVFGSLHPWAEAAFLNAGVDHVTTVEYAAVACDHPQLTIITPDRLASAYLAGDQEPADFIFSYSTFEHDGLGRYGDPLNPTADLESIARTHCLLKEDGLLFFGVPVGTDAVIWNAHRIYGVHRLKLIFSFWEVLDVVGMAEGIASPFSYANQPIWVLRKKKMKEVSLA